MAKRKFKQIVAVTRTTGYSLTVDGRSYLYHNEHDFAIGVIAHVVGGINAFASIESLKEATENIEHFKKLLKGWRND